MKTTLKTKQKSNITLMLCLKNRAFFKRCFVALVVCGVIMPTQMSYSQNGSRGKLSKVVIDAGHGGKDSGARGRNSLEKDIVLAVALKVGKLIADNCKDVQVVYTRATDEFIPLDERSNIANRNNANLFISIHANSNKSSVPFGAETYVMGLHKSADNFEVAANENSAIVLEDNYNSKYEGFNPKSVESYIIFSMMQSKFLDQSLYFAQTVQSQMVGYANRSNRGVKQAGFLVLWRTAMPSVLIELGFISNANDEHYMMSEKGQNELAESIYRSFKNYKSSYEGSDYSALPSVKKQIAEDTSTKSKGSGSEDRDEPIIKESLGKTSVEYRVQVAASVGKPLTKSQIRNLGSDVDEVVIGRIYKYTKGVFSKFDEANTFLGKIRKSHRDAFVIALENGKLISINDALRKQ